VQVAVEVHPPRDEIDALVPPLEPGERRVYRALLEYLDGDAGRWDLYVQPFMLGNHPDFVVAGRAGVTVIEVKDWGPGLYRPMDGRLEVRDPDQGWRVKSGRDADPLRIVHEYRSQLSGTYLTPPGESERFQYVVGVLILPQWREGEARRLLDAVTALETHDASYVRVRGQPALDNVARLVGGAGSANSERIPESWIARLRQRLAEPEARALARRPLQLSGKAREIAQNPRGVTMRRVKGPAGSGKSVALAARAAHLAADGRSVLVLSFNITLAHYLSDLVGRHARTLRADRRLIDLMHFHGFCGRVIGRKRTGLSPDQQVRKAIAAYASGRRRDLPQYDAILVDEGQDFERHWWTFLRDHVRTSPTGEMLLSIDTTQTIYGAKGWTDEPMPGMGFRGLPMQLEGSYRLPPDLVVVLNRFAQWVMNRDDLDLPSVPPDRRGVAVPPSDRTWRDVAATDLVDAATETVDWLVRHDGVNPVDVVVLAGHRTGLPVMSAVDERLSLPVEHIFTAQDDEERRISKGRFWPGVAAVKGTTIHSYKGWESGTIVLCIDEHLVAEHAESDLATLVYIALTRVHAEAPGRAAAVHVINGHPGLSGFASEFEREVPVTEAEALAGQLAMGVDDT
jgi:hypothetical protein